MTDVSTEHPADLPAIELLDSCRKITFRKDCLGDVKVSRSINKGAMEVISAQARSPYIDEREFPPGTHLVYEIELEHEGEQHKYDLEVML